MSTNATITVQHADESFSQIYLHWDGHIDTCGKTLLKGYNTLEKAEELVALGDLSQIGVNIGAKIDFDARAPEQCIAYGRDRGEDGTEALKFKSFALLVQDGGIQSYNYIFIDGIWLVQQNNLTAEGIEALALHPEAA